MKSRQGQKVKEGVQPFLDEGEEVLEAVVVRPRGWTQQHAGSFLVGGSQQGKAFAGAERAGIKLDSPMAVAVTSTRLLTLKIGSPIGLGVGGEVKELLSGVPVSAVDSVEVNRLALGYVITITAGGEPFKLEAGAGSGAKPLAEAFERVKGAAAV